MRARKTKCPDCGAKAKRVSQKWRCDRCLAGATFLGKEPVMLMRYLTYSRQGGGWRLNPFHPQASLMTRLRARTVGA